MIMLIKYVEYADIYADCACVCVFASVCVNVCVCVCVCVQWRIGRGRFGKTKFGAEDLTLRFEPLKESTKKKDTKKVLVRDGKLWEENRCFLIK